MTSSHDDRLAAALLRYQAPAALREALAAARRPDIHLGQIWRASVRGTSVLVLITSEFVDGTGEVVVATPGHIPPAETAVDHRTVSTEVFRSLTLWSTVRGALHHRTLDVMIEHSDTSTELAQHLSRSPRGDAFEVDPFDPAADLVAELLDDFTQLQSAPAVPQRAETSVPLASMLPGGARDQLVALIEHLGVTQHQGMELLRGRRSLTAEQARILEAAVGIGPGTLPSSAGVNSGLALEIEHPRWRDAARRYAARHGQDEVTARTSLATEAYALAARESTAEPDWQQRIALLVAGEP